MMRTDRNPLSRLSAFASLAGLIFLSCLDPDVLNESDPWDHHGHFAPSWSRDGNYISFHDVRGTDRLVYANATTGAIVHIRDHADIGPHIDRRKRPIWDVNDSALLVNSDSVVYRVSLDGSDVTTTIIPPVLRSISDDGSIATSDVSPGYDADSSRYIFAWIRSTRSSGAADQFISDAEIHQWHERLGVFISTANAGKDSLPGLVILGHHMSGGVVDTIGWITWDPSEFAGDPYVLSDPLFESLDPTGERALWYFTWSPPDGSQNDYRVTDLRTSRTSILGDIYRPSWNSDGSKVVFEYPYRKKGGIGIINSDGSEERVLTGP